MYNISHLLILIFIVYVIVGFIVADSVMRDNAFKENIERMNFTLLSYGIPVLAFLLMGAILLIIVSWPIYLYKLNNNGKQ